MLHVPDSEQHDTKEIMSKNNSTQDTDELLRSLPDAVAILEHRFQDNGLVFDRNGFHGLEPVQAFGTYQDMRFYFRSRGKSCTLTVGFHDVEAAEKRRDEHVRHYQEKLKKDPDDVFTAAYIDVMKSEVYAADDQVSPNLVMLSSGFHRDEGTFTGPDDMVTVFEWLLDTLDTPRMVSASSSGGWTRSAGKPKGTGSSKGFF